jgi:hypothetical protein
LRPWPLHPKLAQLPEGRATMKRLKRKKYEELIEPMQAELVAMAR